MLAIRLPESIEARLNALAQATGRAKSTLAREAILEYLDDLEDDYLAEARARKNRKAIPLADQAKPARRVSGLHKDNILHISEDFDAPLPDAFWQGNGPE